jgi:p-aminobenzoyl-glutamate transporter AbgT
MSMQDFLGYMVIVALLAAFILLLLRKWRVIEWMQVHGNDFFSEMALCNFCLSWWVSVFLSLICVVITGDLTLLLIPFCSTPLTTKYLI